MGSRFAKYCRTDLMSLLGAILRGRVSPKLPSALHHILHLAGEFMSDTTKDHGLYFDYYVVDTMEGLVPESRNEKREEIFGISEKYIKKWSEIKAAEPWMV